AAPGHVRGWALSVAMNTSALPFRSWTGLWAFLAPPVYLGLVVALQPDDRLGEPDAAPWLGRLVYDDYDVTAMALRGLNADRGRTPGQLEPPPALPSDDFHALLSEPVAARPRYFLEYPPAALLLFCLPWEWNPPPTVPAAVLDACHNSLVEHEP